MIDKNFELIEIEKIGEGANGKVLKYFDQKSWKFYAVKL